MAPTSPTSPRVIPSARVGDERESLLNSLGQTAHGWGCGRSPNACRWVSTFGVVSLGMRVLHIIFVLFVLANVIEVIDQSGVAEHQPAVASTAQATRALLSADHSVEIPREPDPIIELVDEVVGSFDEVLRALE